MKVKVIRLAGETGLRLPGTFMEVGEDTARRFAKMGLVELPVEQKQEKAVIETKEEKVTVQTKGKPGRKRKDAGV